MTYAEYLRNMSQDKSKLYLRFRVPRVYQTPANDTGTARINMACDGIPDTRDTNK